jgi:HJR/Mrr/RecB family endonuclease
MLEELGVALLVAIGVIWLLVKIFQGFARGVESSAKSIEHESKRWLKQRQISAKSKLVPSVRIVVPNELGVAQHKVSSAESDFRQFQGSIGFVAQRPAWQRCEFVTCRISNKRTAHGEMSVEDIRDILEPDSKTWLDKETQTLAQPCSYPAPPPKSTLREFREFPQLTLNMESAKFEVDPSKIREKQIAKYFGEERRSVNAYNDARTQIMQRVDLLNQQIKTWNDDLHQKWEKYAHECKLFAEEETAAFSLCAQRYIQDCREQKDRFKTMQNGYKEALKDDVIQRIDFVLDSLSLPHSLPHAWEIDFDEEHRILIVEFCLPDIVNQPPFKFATLKSGRVKKPLNQTERKEIIPRVHPAILLRVAYELFRNDDTDLIKLLVLNGWILFDDPRTGVNTKAYTASLMVEKHQIMGLNLEKIDSLAAFEALHGKSAGKLAEIIPIEPTLSLNKKDSRFVDAKEVLSTLNTATNLAAMDWQDFEHLIRELFEKEFAGRNAEVKITQASRDRGVDAIVFDPDPIRGGKYVIQAKRYTNTVDVSSVRDLVAVVKKEGASRGILVTTSSYGADAYAFANNEPITLLTGAELLGLLRKHGYSFRIDLQEARKLSQGSFHSAKATST